MQTTKRNIYLERYAHPKSYLTEQPEEDLGIVVVIPAYREPDIFSTLTSLSQCLPPTSSVEVIVVLNYSDKDPKEVKFQTEKDFGVLREWMKHHSTRKLSFHVLLQGEIPYKIAGPGMARKIGMDEAIRRFEFLERKNGILVSLDADCRVEKNYLCAIEKHWNDHPDTTGASIHFEHPTNGDLDPSIYEGIIDYELHLRYYINAQLFAGFPFAHQTVGSSFAVSSDAYQKQGGMNKRKAGEDFYFLHKIIPLGNYYNLSSTTVFPSPRPSDRVPFGTGRAIKDYLRNNRKLTTYNVQSFKDLKLLFEVYTTFFQCSDEQVRTGIRFLPASLRGFLETQHFIEGLRNINENCSGTEGFTKGFFRWFNAFRLMKYVHYARDNFYSNQGTKEAGMSLLYGVNKKFTSLKLLQIYRKADRSSDGQQLIFQNSNL